MRNYIDLQPITEKNLQELLAREKELVEIIHAFNSDMFLSFGYVKQLEEVRSRIKLKTSETAN